MVNRVNRKFVEISNDFFQFETPGDSVEGTLIGRSTQQFGHNSVGRYTLASEDGRTVKFLGSVQLDDLLSNVVDGTYIRLTYTGNTTTANKRQLKQYKLEIAE